MHMVLRVFDSVLTRKHAVSTTVIMDGVDGPNGAMFEVVQLQGHVVFLRVQLLDEQCVSTAPSGSEGSYMFQVGYLQCYDV